MLFKKDGFPEEGELVICTVTKVHPTSVFCNLDDYGKTGMIYISEVSPGRIRNIRDFVKEGKMIVCKVLQIRLDRGHIDLSLRRVSDAQRRGKVEEMKQEQKAEKMVEFVAEKLKMDFKVLYTELSAKIFPDYGALHPCFESVVLQNLSLEDVGIAPKIANELTEVIRQRISLPEVEITGKFKISSYAPDGVEVIKRVLKKTQALDSNLKIHYEGGGSYNIIVKSSDYKAAEKLMNSIEKTTLEGIQKEGGTGQFSRTETK